MPSIFKRKEEIMKHLEENEAKYKNREAVDFEKGDKLAIFLASFLTFAPLLLLLILIFLVTVFIG